MDCKVTVLGSGSWGTAQAAHLQRRGCRVTIWGIETDVLTDLRENGLNRAYFGDLPVCSPGAINTETDLLKAIEGAEFIVCAVPSAAVRSVSEQMKDYLDPKTIIISTAKGLESGTLMRMSEVLSDVVGRLERIAVLSGPSFAAEVIKGLPTAVTIACAVPRVSAKAAALYHYKSFRVYSSSDIVGVELGGSIKNVIALAAGMLDGAGMGYNARAALMTRGLAELSRIITAMGGRSATVQGLSCLGDLLLTSTGTLSRNHQVGVMLGKGRKLDEIMKEMHQVAEGVKCAESCLQLAQSLNIETPIIKEITRVIDGEHNLQEAIDNLFSRAQKFE